MARRRAWRRFKHLQPEPPSSSGDRERQAFGDQVVGRAGLFAGVVGLQHLRRQGLDLADPPGAELAQELALVLPEDPDALGRLLGPRPALLQDRGPAELGEVLAYGAPGGGAAFSFGPGPPERRLGRLGAPAESVLRRA